MSRAKKKADQEPAESRIRALANQQAIATPTLTVAGIETRMVGRDAELLILQNMFLDAIEDADVRVVTIVGDAGVGKSRLLYEFEKWLEWRPGDISFFKGRAGPESEAIPYGLIRRLFAYRLEILESDSAAKVREKFRAGMSPALTVAQADMVGQLAGLDFSQSKAVQNQLGSESFAKLLGVALGHPSLEVESRQLGELVLEGLRSVMPTDSLEAAMERGKRLEPEAVVAGLVGSATGVLGEEFGDQSAE